MMPQSRKHQNKEQLPEEEAEGAREDEAAVGEEEQEEEGERADNQPHHCNILQTYLYVNIWRLQHLSAVRDVTQKQQLVTEQLAHIFSVNFPLLSGMMAVVNTNSRQHKWTVFLALLFVCFFPKRQVST